MYDVLVIGADGMVGSVVFNYLRNHSKVLGTSRRDSGLFYKYVANRDPDSIKRLLSILNSGALVINCVVRLDLSGNNCVDEASLLESIEINTIFPHLLAKETASMGMRLIHISTDAVFGSNSGIFAEDMSISPNTAYGMTKALGEISGDNAITIRCSLLGPSCGAKKGGLWNWILNSEKNAILHGYVNNYWTGVTTLQFARICHALLDQARFFSAIKKYGSLHHLCPNEILTKYELIYLIAKKIRPDLRIEIAKSKTETNRRLVSKYNELNKFIEKIQWDDALEELVTLQMTKIGKST